MDINCRTGSVDPFDIVGVPATDKTAELVRHIPDGDSLIYENP